MSMLMRIVAFLALTLCVLHPTAAAGAQSTQVDMAVVIRAAANARAGGMKLSAPLAVKRLDDLLISDYGAKGRIASETNAGLKSLYTQAAHLMLNGHVIAGGTLIVIAKQEPGYARSPVGPALDRFVNTMLAPVDDEDSEQSGFALRAAKARAQLSSVRAELQMAAQLRVMGAIYDDQVAVDAGEAALRAQGATAGERASVASALLAAGRK